MIALDFFQTITEALFIVTFLATVYRALRRPRRWTVDAALFFAGPAFLIAVKWMALVLRLTPPDWLGSMSALLIMALPYLLIRLLGDFLQLSAMVTTAAVAGLVLAAMGLLLIPPPLSPVIALMMAGYVAAYAGYAALIFAREGHSTRGISRRRMYAVAAGAGFGGFAVAAAGLQGVWPGAGLLWQILSVGSALLSAVGFMLAFAPPPIVRRLMRQPEFVEFLQNVVVSLAGRTEREVALELERRVANAMAAEGAALGLVNDTRGVIVLSRQPYADLLVEHPIAGVTLFPDRMEVSPSPGRDLNDYLIRRAVLVDQVEQAAPEWRAVVRAAGIRALVAAPVRFQTATAGLLCVYSARPPVFAEDDLEMAQLLADQCAVVLATRRLVEATQLAVSLERTREMKAEFLAAAAHDLKSPLTAIILELQLLLRRSNGDLSDGPRATINAVIGQSKLLGESMQRMLEASRGRDDVGELTVEWFPLLEVVEEVARTQSVLRRPVPVSASGATEGRYDRSRIAQLLTNLIDNSFKYSPEGGEVRVNVRGDATHVQFAVSDNGRGIPPEELPHIFERYRRSRTAEDRGVPGMGLGLYICRSIAEAHNGEIWAESAAGKGTTVFVRLPRAA